MWFRIFVLSLNFCFLCFLYAEAIKLFVCWRGERNPLQICLESYCRMPAPWGICETVQLVSVVFLLWGNRTQALKMPTIPIDGELERPIGNGFVSKLISEKYASRCTTVCSSVRGDWPVSKHWQLLKKQEVGGEGDKIVIVMLLICKISRLYLDTGDTISAVFQHRLFESCVFEIYTCQCLSLIRGGLQSMFHLNLRVTVVRRSVFVVC